MFKWMAVLVLGCLVGWLPGAVRAQAANQCSVNGGTGSSAYRDCQPAQIKGWSVTQTSNQGPLTAPAGLFATPQQAANAYYDHQAHQDWTWQQGTRGAPAQPYFCSVLCQFTLVPKAHPNGASSYLVSIISYGSPQAFSSPSQTITASIDAVYACPTGYVLQGGVLGGVSDVNANGDNVYVCRPANSFAWVVGNSAFGDTSNTEGNVCSGDPVSLDDLHEVYSVVDYQNESPYPIVWSRTFNGRLRQWFFNYDRTVATFYNPSNPLVASVTLRRQDGQLLVFAGSRTTAQANWTWTPDLGTAQNASVLGTLTTANDLSQVTFRNHADETETYNAQGQLISLADPRGLPLQFTYDGQGRLTLITDASSRTLSFTYDPTQQTTQTYNSVPVVVNNQTQGTTQATYTSYPSLTASQLAPYPLTASDGHQTVGYVFEFNANSSSPSGSPTAPIILDQVIQADNTTVTYLYDGIGRLTGIQDENGDPFATFVYGDPNSANVDKVLQTYHGDHHLTLNYAPATTTITYPNNATVQYGQDATSHKVSSQSTACSWCDGLQNQSTAYDAASNPTTLTDFNGNTESRTYDQVRGVPLSITEAVGTPVARTTTYTWDSRFLKPSTVVSPVQTTTGPGTRTAQFTYDNQGNLTAWLLTVGTTSRAGSATYNSFGEPLTITNARGKTTQMAYDAQGNLSSATDALGHVTTYGGYDAAGRVGWATDPNGLQTQFLRDNRGRIVTLLRGCDSSVGADCHWENTTITYTPFGAVASIVQPNRTGVAYHYDTAHRRTQVDFLVNGFQVQGSLFLTLSESGEVTAKVYKDASGNVLQSQAFNYDTLSRLTDQLDSRAKDFSQGWDPRGNLVSTNDPLSHGTTNTYDALNRLVGTLLPDQSTESKTYGPDDTVTSQTDALGHTTTTTYNGYGEAIINASPDYSGGLTDIYNRDANGNVLEAVGPTSDLFYTYDDLDRPLTKGNPSQTGNFTYTYDACTNGVGHLCAVSSPTQTVTFEYDRWGRMTAKAQSINGTVLTIGYGYDNQGQLSTIQYPSGAVMQQYWWGGQVTSQTWNGQSTLMQATYDPLGHPTSFMWPTGRTFNLTWDTDGRLSAATAGTDGQTYGYDDAWRLTQVAHQPANTTETFGYDARDRLTSGTTWGSYTYDANGNRLSWLGALGPMAYLYDPASDRLASINADPVTLDAGGKITQMPGYAQLGYDAFNRLSHVMGNGDTVSFTYNGLGERTSKFVSSTATVTNYVYSSPGHLLGVYDNAGNALEEYIYVGERPVATIRNGNVYTIETDQLMAPVRVLDPVGTQVWSWDGREPFGASTPLSHPLLRTAVPDGPAVPRAVSGHRDRACVQRIQRLRSGPRPLHRARPDRIGSRYEYVCLCKRESPYRVRSVWVGGLPRSVHRPLCHVCGISRSQCIHVQELGHVQRMQSHR